MKKGFRWAIMVLLAVGVVLSISMGVIAGEAVTLKVWIPDPEEDIKAFYNSVARAFEADNPGIKVVIESMGDAITLYTKIRAAAAAKQMPDVLKIYGSQWIYVLGQPGMLLPLSNYLDLTRFISEGFLPWEAESKPELKGQILAIPITVSGSEGIGYNKDMFVKYGISVPHTWEEYLGVLKTLKSKGIVPLTCLGKDVNNVALMFEGWLTTVKNDVLAYKKLLIDKTISFQDPGVIETMEMFKDLAQYFGPGWENYDITQASQLFYQGKIAIGPGGLRTISYIKDNFPDLNYDIFGPLTYKGVTFKSKSGSTENFAVVSSSNHKDEAIKFVQYLVSDKVQVKHFLELGGVPSVKGILAKKEIVAYLAKEPLMRKVLGSVYENLRPNLVVDLGNREVELQTKLGEGLVAIGLGLKTVSKVAAELEAVRQTLLKGK